MGGGGSGWFAFGVVWSKLRPLAKRVWAVSFMACEVFFESVTCTFRMGTVDQEGDTMKYGRTLPPTSSSAHERERRQGMGS